MENLEYLSNAEKVVISALLGDALQLASGLKYQLQEIQEAFADLDKLKDSIQWLNMVSCELGKMRKDLDESIDWQVMEGTEWQADA